MPAATIGVLALQGGVREHVAALRALGAETVEVRTPEQLDGLDGLILPGGESTVVSLLLASSGLREPLEGRLRAGQHLRFVPISADEYHRTQQHEPAP